MTNNLGSPLAAGYAFEPYFSLSRSSSVRSKSLPSGDDIRIVFWDGKGYKELDRDLLALVRRIRLVFPTQADIPAYGQDGRYWLYYGNSLAGQSF